MLYFIILYVGAVKDKHTYLTEGGENGASQRDGRGGGGPVPEPMAITLPPGSMCVGRTGAGRKTQPLKYLQMAPVIRSQISQKQ